MDHTDPKVTILARRTLAVSPWLEIDEIDVRMPGCDRVETYHGVRHADAVCVLAMTPAGQFLLVRQYRPVIDAWSWELPAGAVDDGETPAKAGARELNEETGFRVEHMIPLGATHEDPPRRTNRLFGFFAIVEPTVDGPEPGMRSRLVSGEVLRALAASGELAVPSQVALVWKAGLNAEVRAHLAARGLSEPPWL
jgi:8-oxo-dGTP pyrophosphatase MutT (NUDIX family)